MNILTIKFIKSLSLCNIRTSIATIASYKNICHKPVEFSLCLIVFTYKSPALFSVNEDNLFVVVIVNFKVGTYLISFRRNSKINYI